jgi:phosphomannomutase/phosphoglucomutase
LRREIFREYDIRGIAGEDLTQESVEDIGRGIGTMMRRNGSEVISVGRDCRLSSDFVRDALVHGINATGVSVIDIGLVPTPLLYYSLFVLAVDGGVMITGSHNPAEYNGFKTCVGRNAIHGAEIQRIYDLIVAKDFDQGSGDTTREDVIKSYKKYVLEQIKLPRTVRVALDCGNGTAGVLAPELLSALGCELSQIYCEVDGRFPNHHPDPTVVENLVDLQALVRREQLEFGVSFDGDGDRIGVVVDEGTVIWGGMLMSLFAREILERKPKATFVSEVKCSMNLYNEIERLGGRAIMWKTGHSLIKAKMKQEKAALAGEMSGHMFFADRYFGYDDAIYTACRLAEIMANSPSNLSQLLSDLPPKYATPEIRVNCDDAIKFDVVKKVKDHYKQHYEVIDVDGARILFAEGWGLVRASNTQDVLVLRFEADSETDLDRIRSQVEEQVSQTIERFEIE